MSVIVYIPTNMFSQPIVYLKEYVQLLDLLCWRDVKGQHDKLNVACDSL